MGVFDIAQYCRNGHSITQEYEDRSETRKNFCTDCGAPTVCECEHCEAPIRGQYSEGYASYSSVRPNHCYECGKPHPWLAEKLAAAEELAAMAGDLSADEQKQVTRALGEIASDGPRTEIGALRIKQLVGKAGKTVGDALYRIAVDVASEAAKKMLVP